MNLTMKRLRAIEEALCARLAGPLDIDADRADYESALTWAENRIERIKQRRTVAPAPRLRGDEGIEGAGA